MAKRKGIEIPETGSRILCLDLGTKKTGIAISDTQKRVAFPHSIFEGSQTTLVGHLQELLYDLNIQKLIIGLPTHLTGQPHEKEAHIRALGAEIGLLYSIPVDYQDERLSTAEAQDKLDNTIQITTKDDHVAAQVILQRYLDRQLS